MNTKLKNILLTWLKTIGYTLAGIALTAILDAIPGIKPADPSQAFIWTVILVPVLSGACKALLRLIQWDPSKVGR